MHSVRGVRVTGVVEAVTYLVLLATLVWRVALDGPDLSAAVGPVHGVAFLAYCGAVLVARDTTQWSGRHTVVLLLASIVPLGGFAVARRLDPGA